MCTSATFSTATAHYVGRNLDFEMSYNQTVVITPRNYGFTFRHEPQQNHHYAMIGMASVVNNYPLYFDATNEYGLSMEGLMYQGNATYFPQHDGMYNVCSFELIPWLLGQCRTVDEAITYLKKTNVCDDNFAPELPHSPMHFLMADQQKCIVIEPDRDGLHYYDNPFGVLTNNPPFPLQQFNMNNYVDLHTKNSDQSFHQSLDLTYSRGMGTRSLPGGMDSMSRFVKVAFTRAQATDEEDDLKNVSQFLHILHSVEQPKGLNEVADRVYEYTIYSSCCNMDTGVYYYTTYYGNQLNAVALHNVDLDVTTLYSYPFIDQQMVNWQN